MAIAFQSVASAATASGTVPLTVTKPTGTVDGDLLVASAVAYSNRTITWPSGWTPVVTTTSGTVFLKVETRYRIAASEGASYNWTLDASKDLVVAILRIDGHHATVPLDASGGQANLDAGSTSNTAPSISASATDDMLVGIYGTTTGTSTTHTMPGGMTERADLGSTSSPDSSPIFLAVGTEIITATGATGTRVATQSQAARSIGQLIAFAPNTGSGGGPLLHEFGAVPQGIMRGLTRGIS